MANTAARRPADLKALIQLLETQESLVDVAGERHDEHTTVRPAVITARWFPSATYAEAGVSKNLGEWSSCRGPSVTVDIP